MKINKLVSIIVPAYNASSYINSCIESIVSQSYKYLELIIINDGSTDDTELHCLKWLDKDQRIKYFKIENSGPAAARNYGIAKATGDYIGFVDADDTIELLMYETMIAAAIDDDLDIVMCGYRAVSKASVNDINITIPTDVMTTNEEIKDNIIKRYYFGKSEGVASLCNKIYKRQFIVDNKLFIDETRVRAEDYWFNMNAFILCTRFKFINECFYNYQNVNQLSVMKSFRENQFKLFLNTRDELIELNNVIFKFDSVNERLNSDVKYLTLEYIHLIMLSFNFKVLCKFIDDKAVLEVIRCQSDIKNRSRYYNFLANILNIKYRSVRIALIFVIFSVKGVA